MHALNVVYKHATAYSFLLSPEMAGPCQWVQILPGLICVVALLSELRQPSATTSVTYAFNKVPINKCNDCFAAAADTYFAPVDFTVLRDVDRNLASRLEHSLR